MALTATKFPKGASIPTGPDDESLQAKEKTTTQKGDAANRRFKASEKDTSVPAQNTEDNGEQTGDIREPEIHVTGDQLKSIETAHKEVEPDPDAPGDPYAEIKKEVERLKKEEDAKDRRRAETREKYSDKSKFMEALGQSRPLEFHPPGRAPGVVADDMTGRTRLPQADRSGKSGLPVADNTGKHGKLEKSTSGRNI